MSHFEFDIHTHTIASGHGSAATITDMVKTARTQHLNMLGISAVPCHTWRRKTCIFPKSYLCT